MFFYDFTNFWTLGLPELVKGTIAPENEHWLSSFGLATSVIGGVKAVTPAKPMSGVSERLGKPKETIKSAEENTHKGMGEAKIEIPKGEMLNVGKLEAQSIKKTGIILSGRADHILLPRDWPLECIKDIRYVPSK